MKPIRPTLFRAACAVLAAVLFAAADVSFAGQASAPVRPDLSGRWQLNKDLSEDAEKKLAGMREARRGESGRGGRAGGGFGGSGGFGGRAGMEEMRAQMEEARRLVLDPPTQFVLTQDAEKVVLTEPDGRVRRLVTNNLKTKVDGRDVRTRWDNIRLVSETTAGFATVVQTFERSSDTPSQLIVTSRMEMRGQQISVRRVYDGITD